MKDGSVVSNWTLSEREKGGLRANSIGIAVILRVSYPRQLHRQWIPLTVLIQNKQNKTKKILGYLQFFFFSLKQQFLR